MIDSELFHPKTIISSIRYILIFGGLIAVVWSIPQIYHLVSMTIIALLISYVLNPFVKFLERRGFNRVTSTTIVFLIIILLMIWGIVEISPFLWNQSIEMKSFLVNNQPTELLEDYLRGLENNFGFLPEGSLTGQVSTAYNWVMTQLSNIPQLLYIILQYLLIVPFIAFFFTRDRRKMRRFVVQSVPNQFFEMIFNLYYKVDEKLGAYIRGVIIESLIIALLSIVGLWIVEVKYFIVIGIFAGISNIVPYFGPVAGAILAVVVKALEAREPSAILSVLVVFIIVQLVDNIFVKPMVVSSTMNIHPLVVLLVVLAGGQLYGIAGMIFSIPLVSMFFVIVSEVNWAIRNYSFKM